jgi:hypothetical protein
MSLADELLADLEEKDDEEMLEEIKEEPEDEEADIKPLPMELGTLHYICLIAAYPFMFADFILLIYLLFIELFLQI